jgi:hypothetical protein
MQQIIIYAELLANLGQVSIAISLPSLCDESTGIELLQNDSILTHHEGRKKSLRLPADVVGTVTLKIPSNPTKELSFRLPISEHISRDPFKDNANPVPWTAESLDQDSTVFCRSCGIALVPSKTINDWKALPSQNWAEMMEFWHCHKPSENSNDQEKLLAKGYSSGNAPSVRPGIGFVDTCSLIVSKQDCSGLEVCYSFRFILWQLPHIFESIIRATRRRSSP